MARGGRRRRVLNDEVRSASGLSLAAYQGGPDPDAPRYGEQANVEHHPQVTDFVPRRARTMIVMLAAGCGMAAAAQATIRYADPISAAVAGIDAADLVAVAGGVIAWTSAALLLIVALLAKLMFSLRRHRVDDYAGRYRVWRWISWAAVLASINSVTNIQSVVAKLAVVSTGWSLTSTGAEWWLAPLALVAGWLFVRLLMETSESRSATALLLVAAGCYATAAAGALGWAPTVIGAWSAGLATALPLVGHSLALAGLLVFGRYVVLDVQGLIEHAPRLVAAPAAAKPAAAIATAKADASAERNVTPADPTDWSDDDQADEDESGRRLSKADRRRLRKQQRAA